MFIADVEGTPLGRLQHWLPVSAGHDGGFSTRSVIETTRLFRDPGCDCHVAAPRVNHAPALHLHTQRLHAVMEADWKHQVSTAYRRRYTLDLFCIACPCIHAEDRTAVILDE